MKLIRWDGDPSPFDDINIRKLLSYGRLPMEDVEKMRFYETKQRISVIPGPPGIVKSEYAVGPESGYSRHYLWTDKQREQWMEDTDAAKLLANEWDRWQFRNVTDVPGTQRPPLTKRQWGELFAAFSKLDARRRLRRGA